MFLVIPFYSNLLAKFTGYFECVHHVHRVLQINNDVHNRCHLTLVTHYYIIDVIPMVKHGAWSLRACSYNVVEAGRWRKSRPFWRRRVEGSVRCTCHYLTNGTSYHRWRHQCRWCYTGNRYDHEGMRYYFS